MFVPCWLLFVNVELPVPLLRYRRPLLKFIVDHPPHQDQYATIAIQTIMENGTENEYYENDDKHELLSPLLLVPTNDAMHAPKSRGDKRFVALLLVVVTAAATAMIVLVNYSSSTVGVKPNVSLFSSLLGTGRKQDESCDSPWWNACGDR